MIVWGVRKPPEDGIDESDDIALQVQDLNCKNWWIDAEHATSESRRCPTMLNLYKWQVK